MKGILIRTMNFNDCEQVAKINLEAWKEAYSGIIPTKYLESLNLKDKVSNWREGFDRWSNLIRLVATQNNEIMGYVCGLHNRGDENRNIDGELWAIYVDPRYKSRGIGHKLILSFKAELVKRNFKSMNVWVLAQNTQAIKFYERCGGELASYSKEIEIGGAKLKEVCYEFININD